MSLFAPICHVEAIDRAMLNRCLVEWGHKMGPLERPSYAIEAHQALMHDGVPVAVTASSDTVREVVADTLLARHEVVELSRLCAIRPDLCRVMLRLWREFVWPPIAAIHKRRWAISYQDTALHSGDTYRFDGWAEIGRGKGGSTDQRTGRKGRSTKIWGWPRDVADVVAARRE